MVCSPGRNAFVSHESRRKFYLFYFLATLSFSLCFTLDQKLLQSSYRQILNFTVLTLNGVYIFHPNFFQLNGAHNNAVRVHLCRTDMKYLRQNKILANMMGGGGI